MRTIILSVSIVSLFSLAAFFSHDLYAQRNPDSTGVGSVIVDVAVTPDEPNWEEWRHNQNAILSTMEKPNDLPAGFEGNPIDWYIEKWVKDNDQKPGKKSEDHLFLRKAYLDVTGLLPPIDQRKEFLSDKDPNKREKLIDSLLRDNNMYAEHWMTFWNDLLRNDEQTNIDNLRGSVSNWLFDSLKHNTAYDIMVAQLLNPSEKEATGFLKGINWRGRINASQRPVIQVAQNVGQVFLSTTLKCASCHNHFTKPYQLNDTYGLAAFFAEEPIDIYRCDKLTGETAKASFSLLEGEEVDPDAGLIERRAAAVRMITSPKNERFSQSIVNRLWHKLIGRGLFEPVDDLDVDILYPEMLAWLAYDFKSHGYDIKHTMRLILTSKAYSMASAAKRVIPYTPEYTNPSPRRMSSEQFWDNVAIVTQHYLEHDSLYRVHIDNPIIRTWRYRTPNSLSIAMGRPNREQVVSVRDEQANILQMLEMVNGDDLADRLAEAADYIYEHDQTFQNDKKGFIRDTYIRAYSHPPTEAETKIGLEMFGITDAFRKLPTPSPKEQKQNIEDFLWIVFMSPEFQFIH